MKAIDRIYQYIDYKEVSPKSFEERAELSNGYLGKQRKRNADLGESILLRILENCPEINPEWLLTGKGEMLKESNSNYVQKLSSPDSLNEPEDNFLKKYIRSLELSNELMSQEIERLRKK